MKHDGQYTLSYHFFGLKHPSNHIDLFLQFPYYIHLTHYHINLNDYRNKYCTAVLGKDHRSIYMQYQGKISGNRGKVRILQKGFFSMKLLKKNTPTPYAEISKLAQVIFQDKNLIKIHSNTIKSN